MRSIKPQQKDKGACWAEVETGQRQERHGAGHVPEVAGPGEEKGQQMVVEVSSAWEGVLAPLKPPFGIAQQTGGQNAGLEGCAVTPLGHTGRLRDPCSFPRPRLSHLSGVLRCPSVCAGCGWMGTFDLHLAAGTGPLNWQKSLWLGNVRVSLQGSPLTPFSPELPAAIRGDPGVLTGSPPVGPRHSSAPLPHVLLLRVLHLCRADMPPVPAHGAWASQPM